MKKVKLSIFISFSLLSADIALAQNPLIRDQYSGSNSQSI